MILVGILRLLIIIMVIIIIMIIIVTVIIIVTAAAGLRRGIRHRSPGRAAGVVPHVLRQ